MKGKVTTTKRPINYGELKTGDIFQWLDSVDPNQIFMLCEDYLTGRKHNVLLTDNGCNAGTIYNGAVDSPNIPVLKLDGIIEAHWVV